MLGLLDCFFLWLLNQHRNLIVHRSVQRSQRLPSHWIMRGLLLMQGIRHVINLLLYVRLNGLRYRVVVVQVVNRCRFLDGFVDLRWGGLNFELLLNFWIIDLILLIHDLIFKLLRDFMVVDNNVVILFWGWRRITLFAHAETEPIRAISFILRQQKSQELVVLSSIPLVDLSEAVIKLNPVDSEGLEIVTSLWVTKSTSVEEGNPHGVDVGFEGVVLRLEDALLELIEELGRGVGRLRLP